MYTLLGLGAIAPETVAKAKTVKPPCYTAEFDACTGGDPELGAACQALDKWYREDPDSYYEYVNTIPYCSESQLATSSALPRSVSDVGTRDVAFGVGGAVLGLLLSFLVR